MQFLFDQIRTSIHLQIVARNKDVYKRQENKQRFYLWDYLWWMGEKWKQARRTGRVDGEMMLSIYILSLIHIFRKAASREGIGIFRNREALASP